MSKIKVDINEIIKLKTRLAEINAPDFLDVEFHDNGVPLSTEQKIYDKFKFVGLNNCDFIWTGFYLETVAEHEQQQKEWEIEYAASEAKRKAIEAARPKVLSPYILGEITKLANEGHLKVVLESFKSALQKVEKFEAEKAVEILDDLSYILGYREDAP